MNSLYIVITNQCQMNCPFCYTQFVPQFQNIESNSHIDIDMVCELLNNGIEIDHKRTFFDHVIFHGGEPLLYPKVLLEIMDRVTAKIDYTVQTNLAYPELSKEQLEVLVRLKGYGTSYSVDRFYNHKKEEKMFLHNINVLNELGVEGSLLVTITEDQIYKQNAYYLWKYIEKTGIKEIILERPIFPLEELKNNKEKYEKLYKMVDLYMMQCCQFIPLEYLNLPRMVTRSLKYNTPLFHTECSKFTYTLYDNLLKFGCPSLESRNVDDKEKRMMCIDCEYNQYCRGDCECMNYVCAFPKRTFDYLRKL